MKKKLTVILLLFLYFYSSIYYDFKPSEYKDKIYYPSYINIDYDDFAHNDSDNLIFDENKKRFLENKNTVFNSSTNTIEDITYDVIPAKDGNLFLENSLNREANLKLWLQIKKIFPENYLSRISKFKTYTDGKSKTLAYVCADVDNTSKWKIALDLEDCLNEYGDLKGGINKILIHEFMHIISLNHCQMIDNPKNTNTLVIEEGTLAEDSYLNLFYNKFWQNHISYLNTVENSDTDYNTISNITLDYYLQHKDEFITDYAATNPVEDISETFLYFVLTDSVPLDNSIKSEKIRFLYTFDELVKIREYIRNNLGLLVDSPRFLLYKKYTYI